MYLYIKLSCLVVVVVVVVVVVFMVMVMLMALHHRNNNPWAPRGAGRLLPLHAGQHGRHGRLLLVVGLRSQRGFGRGHGIASSGLQPLAVTVLQRVLVVGWGLSLVWQVVHILTPVTCGVATVQHRLGGRVVTVAFVGFATSVITSTSLIYSFRGFEKLSTFGSRLCRVVAFTNDLWTSVVNNLGFWLVGARATLALWATNLSLLSGAVWVRSWKTA